jgi:putative tryptophan/tyrosine transport system substrate-binding protein
LSGFSEKEMEAPLRAFRLELNRLGWFEGRNLILDTVSTVDYERMAAEAGRLVSRNSDVIVAMGTPGFTGVRRHTQIVPVVFTLVADPVQAGLITSLARPGGNATGFTNFEFSIGAKWLELLQDLTSNNLTNITVLANPANASANPIARAVESAGQKLSINVRTDFIRNASEIEAAISGAGRRSRGALIVLPDGLAVVQSDLIVGLAERHHIPALYPFRVFADKGGLMVYGIDIPEIYRQAAGYVNRILRGTHPSDLPVQAPNKFELILNLKAARALGLDIPPTLLARADEVIE